MNVLDENIVSSERRRLQTWNIHFRQIGIELGRAGMKDRGEIIPLLHALRRPTFFTRDHDFYESDLRSSKYSLVFLAVPFDEAAEFTRRFLRHMAFRTQAHRMGRVVRVLHNGLSWWSVNSRKEEHLRW